MTNLLPNLIEQPELAELRLHDELLPQPELNLDPQIEEGRR